MNRHILKTWPEPFQAVWDGTKTFEIRKNDRRYQVGDELLLREYEPLSDTYTGREIVCHVPYIFYGGAFGLPDDMCVMSIAGRCRNPDGRGGYFPLWREEREGGA